MGIDALFNNEEIKEISVDSKSKQAQKSLPITEKSSKKQNDEIYKLIKKPTLSDLTPEQQQIYNEFKQNLKNVGIPTNDENFVLRCLKAKQFKMKDCLNLAQRAMKIIYENNPKSITIDHVKSEYNAGVFF